MNLVQAAVLGVTQGASEFAPISSSGHLIVVPWALGWTDVLADRDFNTTFDVALHLGTFVGAAAYLRRDLWRLIVAFRASVASRAVRTPEQRLAWFLALSAIPGALVGALGEDVINRRLGQPWQIALLLAVFGLVLYVVDLRAPQRTSYHDLRGRQAAAMAVGQAVALAPGVSRSGITITAGRATGVDRDAAARFSFLMSLPITLGAALYSGIQLLGEPDPLRGQAGAFAMGMVCAGVTGALAVWGVLGFLRRHSFGSFAVYRVVVALGVLALIASPARGATLP